jgi:hypothetical protein
VLVKDVQSFYGAHYCVMSPGLHARPDVRLERVVGRLAGVEAVRYTANSGRGPLLNICCTDI